MCRVWDESRTIGAERLMLLAMADFCDDSGVCYPGVDRLAKKVNCSIRQAQRHLASLESKGLVSRDHGSGLFVRGARGTGHTTKYQLIFPRETPEDSPKGVTSKVNWGDIQGKKGVTSEVKRGDIAMSPKQSVEPSVRTVRERSGSRPPSEVESFSTSRCGVSSPGGVRLPAEALERFEAERPAAKGGAPQEDVFFRGAPTDGEL